MLTTVLPFMPPAQPASPRLEPALLDAAPLARGRIVRQDEMTRVLRDRPDLTAVLDVLADDPPAPEDPLFALPNAVITPHIAGSHGPECRRMGAMILDDFQRWLDDVPLQERLTRETARHLA